MSFVPHERNSSASPIRPGGPGAAVRAESPPVGYWRRWCADAAPPEAPPVGDPATTENVEVEATPQVVPVEQGEPAYRVLIVEDDRSQALFAQGVLKGAGMDVEVVAVAGETMAAMDRFQPDLMLMDLHMPGMSGTELTAQIRSNPAHAHIPVVFLTGDTDPERHLEVLDSGADDYLSKPVRPRHLIAAVQNRVRRARALKLQREQEVRRHPATGLLTRNYMLQQLSLAFPQQTLGAVHFVVIEGTSALRDHYGYAALDAILTDAGKIIAAVAGERPASRLNDNTFVVYWPGLPTDRHAVWARQLRDAFIGHTLQINGDASLPIAGNGSFAFPPIDDGSAYAVTVLTQPTGPSQACVVDNGTGVVDGADVTDVMVACTTNQYMVGGTVAEFGSALIGSLTNTAMVIVFMGVLAAVHRQLSGADGTVSDVFV